MHVKSVVGAAALLALVAGQMPARAGVFDFSYSGVLFGTTTPQVVSGTLTTGAATQGGLAITGISGTDNGAAITGLSFYNGADNLLFYPASSGLVDHNGLSFTTASLSANIFSDFGTDYLYEDITGATVNAGSFSVTPVPEPGSLLLLGSGLIGLALVTRKRRGV